MVATVPAATVCDVKVVLQRVVRASVLVDGVVVGQVGVGLVALVGVGLGDDHADADRLAAKVASLRMFPSTEGARPFDRSVGEVGGAVLVVSQFTLLGDMRRGNRPSWAGAARPEVAAPLIDRFSDALRSAGLTVETGVFGADMRVELVNDGPVTLVLSSPT
jgi:D-aminoacyl-tRNA deacylase